MAFPLAVVEEVTRVATQEAPESFIIGYRISPEEIHDSDIGYDYEESMQLISEIVKYELDYIHLSLWGGYSSGPVNSDRSYADLFKEVLDDQTKLVVVGGVFSEESARNAVEEYTDLIAVARGTLIEPQFAKKVIEDQGNTIFHEITPENMEYVNWTAGLKEALSRKDSVGLPLLPGGESIRSLHTGRFDMFYRK